MDNEIIKYLDRCDDINYFWSEKIQKAFSESLINSSVFNTSSGYGYNDYGRDKIEEVFAKVFGGEDALVRVQINSGTHAIATALFAVLRPGDTMLSVTGDLYDTIHPVIGLSENSSSLKAFGINYEQLNLKNEFIDFEELSKKLKNKFYRVVYVQRSKGYSDRRTISSKEINDLVKLVKSISDHTLVLVDNCYCEFTEKTTPLLEGADLIMGSLIKNAGGGIASNGGYIIGKKDLVELASFRLNTPGQGKEVGPSLGYNKNILQGLYMGPNATASSLKTGIYASYELGKLGFNTKPLYNEERYDIVTLIEFNDREKLIKFCEGIQMGSAIDSNYIPIPSPLPGYDDDIIMASGSFTSGSSIEISCDGPLREPYYAYLQGGLTFEYGKIAVNKAISLIK